MSEPSPFWNWQIHHSSSLCLLLPDSENHRPLVMNTHFSSLFLRCLQVHLHTLPQKEGIPYSCKCLSFSKLTLPCSFQKHSADLCSRFLRSCETTLDSFICTIIQYLFHWVTLKFVCILVFHEIWARRVTGHSTRDCLDDWQWLLLAGQLSEELWIHSVIPSPSSHLSTMSCICYMLSLYAKDEVQIPSGFKPLLFLSPSIPFQFHF